MTLDWCLRDKGGKHPNTVKRRMTTNEETIEHVNMDTNDSIPEEYTTGIDSIREEYAAGVEHEVFNDEPKGTSSTFAALSPIIPSPQLQNNTPRPSQYKLHLPLLHNPLLQMLESSNLREINSSSLLYKPKPKHRSIYRTLVLVQRRMQLMQKKANKSLMLVLLKRRKFGCLLILEETLH
ncbi:uncharacterized protein LOC125370118 [Ricinus communis]|uniref:uncharacterized protein LOC125370118 n=1 Tax=Ricinus communis TaxID=3988 RepID=UPI00201ABB0D|nr:uncharacterized protein LOC125370118 [Ricinus communis]